MITQYLGKGQGQVAAFVRRSALCAVVGLAVRGGEEGGGVRDALRVEGTMMHVALVAGHAVRRSCAVVTELADQRGGR
jgi:hypothetical protein